MAKRIASGWQPIETAPRDGTPVLVNVMESVQLWGYEWLHAVFGEQVTIAAWLGAPGNGMEVGWVTVATALALIAGARGEVEKVRIVPTHWMPLPPPPADARPAAPDDAVARLPLSTRARNVLAAQGYRTGEDLKRLSEVSDAEILRWPKVGHAVLHEIRSVLESAPAGAAAEAPAEVR